MEQCLVRFPITCPRCGNESLTIFRAVAVAVALFEWRSMRLYSPCHEMFWDASKLELEQIEAYLGTSWIGASPSAVDSVPPLFIISESARSSESSFESCNRAGEMVRGAP